jgi:phosphatidylglycerol:prolipoprotein diacylglycerol transferase
MTSEKISDYISSHYSSLSANGISMDSTLPVHPTFLYESIWCLFGFVVLYIICKKYRKFDGQLILGYGIIYGLERAVVEGLRTDSLYIGNTGLRVSQVLSVLIVVVCLVVLVVKLIKIRKKPVLIEGVDYFPADEKQVKKSNKNKPQTEEKENKDFADDSKKDE